LRRSKKIEKGKKGGEKKGKGQNISKIHFLLMASRFHQQLISVERMLKYALCILVRILVLFRENIIATEKSNRK